MLVIRRQAGDAILINENIEVTVLEISPTRVTLGITAPPEVFILRKEVHLAARQNKAAVHAMDWESIRSAVAGVRGGVLGSRPLPTGPDGERAPAEAGGQD